MPAIERTKRRAFTLIELLVVVAIIALLISILLPSLSRAREQARAAKCGAHLQQFGIGLATYATEYNEWIPGVNTSGVAARVAGAGGDADALRRSYTPIQGYDWMSPFMRYSTELGENRAERLRTLINDYGCPSLQGLTIDFLYAAGYNASPDKLDFTPEIISEYAPLSYLMPAQFQWWGLRYEGTNVAIGYTATGRPIPIPALTAFSQFSATHRGNYQSRLGRLGPPARKIAAADGMRYMTAEGDIDFDINPNATWFGSFASNGGWYAGSQAYGVASGTGNWDGTIVNEGSDAGGRNLAWSYRHGAGTGATVTQGVRSNNGEINAMFFDGHVARLDDRASRNIEFWYPTGATTRAAGALDGLTDVPNGYEVP